MLRYALPLASRLGLVRPARAAKHRLPEGMRAYAVGDLHGRLDLLDALLAEIRRDDAEREPAETVLIFLGDLVDRGPDSRGVVERLLELSREPAATRFLRGNHEEVFLRAVGGDPKATRFLVRMGGRETILSYGLDEEEYRRLDFDELTARFATLVPREHVEFLAEFEQWVELGDYLFVHAGIRPGVPLAEQRAPDLCWIRDEFLDCPDSFGRMVVHGHSITRSIDVRPNRIGIDTGAFATGRLSAVGLEGAERWFLST